MANKIDKSDTFLWDDQTIPFVVSNEAEYDDAIQTIDIQKFFGIGFNKNENENQIRVLQLATRSGHVILFLLNWFKEFPTELKTLLECEQIIKICQPNSFEWLIQNLSESFNVHATSMFNIDHLPFVIDPSDAHIGLPELCMKFAGKVLKRYWVLQNKNWGSTKFDGLTSAQAMVATDNVRACIEIFKCLEPNLVEIYGSLANITAEKLQTLIDIGNDIDDLLVGYKRIRTYERPENITSAVIMEKFDITLGKYGAVGFDCEWDITKPETQLGKLQLASIEGGVIFVELSSDILDFLPTLKEILESDRILKVCIAPEHHLEHLERLCGIEGKNFLDLRFLAVATKFGDPSADTLSDMLRRAEYERQDVKCHAQAAIQLFKEISKSTDLKILFEQAKDVINKDEKPLEDKLRIQADFIEEIRNEKECKRAMIKIWEHCSQYCVVSMDCQWNKPTKVDLLQLATSQGYCALIRLCRLKTLPRNLIAILEDDKIIKVGKCVYSDGTKLSAQYHINVRGLLDIGKVAWCCGFRCGGLGMMASVFLNTKDLRDKTISRSNWASDSNLSEEQLQFSAKNALAGIELFKFFADKAEMKLNSGKDNDYIEYIIGKYFGQFLTKVELDKRVIELHGLDKVRRA